MRMAWLADAVRGIIIVVFFVHIVQLLLPESAMRGYTRFVLGLLVIAAILSPVLAVFNLDYDLQRRLFGMGSSGGAASFASVPEFDAGGVGYPGGPVAAGQALAAAALRRLNDATENRWAQQVASVAALAGGVEPANVEVHLGTGGEPVEIRAIIHVPATGTPEGLRTAPLDPERIRRIVAQFFGLSLEQVEVRVRSL